MTGDGQRIDKSKMAEVELSRARSARLEGRTALIQPNQDRTNGPGQARSGSRFQQFRARRGRHLEHVQRDRDERVIADQPREIDDARLAEPRDDPFDKSKSSTRWSS